MRSRCGIGSQWGMFRKKGLIYTDPGIDEYLAGIERRLLSDKSTTIKGLASCLATWRAECDFPVPGGPLNRATTDWPLVLRSRLSGRTSRWAVFETATSAARRSLVGTGTISGASSAPGYSILAELGAEYSMLSRIAEAIETRPGGPRRDAASS